MSLDSIPRHGNTRYPWASWADGQPHWAKARRDFTCSLEAFRRALFTYAKRHGLEVTTRSDRATNRVWFQFQQPNKP